MNEFRLVLVSGKDPRSQEELDYHQIYTFWRSTWIDTFKTLAVTKPVFSDEFTRQDQIAAIFFKGQCIATTFLRTTDLGQAINLEDSYFSNWPSDAISRLSSKGNRVVICSYFSIHPEFRRMMIGISIKDFLLGFIVKYLLESDAAALCGTPRTDKAMNTACQRWGATTLSEQVDSGYGVKIDLVGFFKDQIIPSTLPILFRQIEDQWIQIHPSRQSYKTAA